MTQTRDWTAVLNMFPPAPPRLTVEGEVLAPTPGYLPQLAKRDPQTGGPDVLQLDLHMIPPSGTVPQVLTWTPARFDRTVPRESARFSKVEIFEDGTVIATVPVEIIT
ncbi:MAG: hypothetical protein ACFE0R_13130 [Salinarimonas sp.]